MNSISVHISELLLIAFIPFGAAAVVLMLLAAIAGNRELRRMRRGS